MRPLAGIFLCVLFSAALWAQNGQESGPVTTILPSKPIRSNDLISVSVLDEPDLSRMLRVDTEGMIRLPFISAKIRAAGLKPEELERSISDTLVSEQILKNPFVTVAVAEYYRPLREAISVIGCVRTPITFQSAEPVSLMEAITRAGGVSADAGPEILIANPPDSPGGSLLRRIPVKALVDSTDPSVNPILTGGEEVRVPEAGHVYVFGNVKKPGTVAIEDGADTTVFKAIALSEGLAQYAGKQAYIFRRENGGNTRSEIPVDLKRIVDHKAPDIPLMANDILYVPDNLSERNTVTGLKILNAVGLAAFSALLVLVLR